MDEGPIDGDDDIVMVLQDEDGDDWDDWDDWDDCVFALFAGGEADADLEDDDDIV